GVGAAQIGWYRLMATPHCAIAHEGSAAATSLKAFSASSYQNEWRSATARTKRAWTAGAHDVGKLTVPSFSGRGWWCAWSFSSAAAGAAASVPARRAAPRDAR